jgi:hypothetical protein
MLDPSDKQRKASLLLAKYGVIDAMTEMLAYSYRLASSKKFNFERIPIDMPLNGVFCDEIIKLSSQSNELILKLSKFRYSCAPDSDSKTMFSDAFVYFNGDIVLKTSAIKTYPECTISSPKIEVSGEAYSVKLFIAGHWLELIGEMYMETKQAGLERDKAKRSLEIVNREKEQETSFSFGEYDND